MISAGQPDDIRAGELVAAFSAAAVDDDQDRAQQVMEDIDHWTGEDKQRLVLVLTSADEAVERASDDPELVLVLANWFSDAFEALGLAWPSADMALRCAAQLLDLDRPDDAESILRETRDLVADFADEYGGSASHLLAICLAQQDQHEEAAAMFAEAGEQSLSAGGLLAAGESFQAQARQLADDSADPIPAQRAADALQRAAAAYRAGDDHAAADEAEGIAGMQLLKVAEAALIERRWAAATTASEAVIALAGSRSDRLDLSVLGQILLARVRGHQDPTTGIALLRRAVDDARRLDDDPGVLGLAEFWLANLLGSTHGVVAELEGLLRSSHQHFILAGDKESAATCLGLLGVMAGTRNDHPRASPLLREAEDQHPSFRRIGQVNEASRLLQSGRPDDARKLLWELLAEGEAAGDPDTIQTVSGMLGALETVAGRHDVAVPLLAQSRAALDPDDIGTGFSRSMLSLFEGITEMAQGNVEHGRAILDEMYAQLERKGSVSFGAMMAMVLASDDLTRRKDPQAAIDRAIPALLELQAFRLSFPSSAERDRWTAYIALLSHRAFQAAAATGDARLMAELIVTVQSQGIPEPIDPGDVAKRPLDSLIELLGKGADHALPSQETELPAAARVQMPWGSIALERHLTGPRDPARLAAQPVLLHVPR